MAALRDRELTAIRQMREVRDALTQHLFATRSGLEKVLNEVADDSYRAIVSGEATPGPAAEELAAPAAEGAPATGKPGGAAPRSRRKS